MNDSERLISSASNTKCSNSLQQNFTGDGINVARNIFSWILRHIGYRKQTDENQEIRLYKFPFFAL
jgi:hypothetical protein